MWYEAPSLVAVLHLPMEEFLLAFVLTVLQSIDPGVATTDLQRTMSPGQQCLVVSCLHVTFPSDFLTCF